MFGTFPFFSWPLKPRLVMTEAPRISVFFFVFFFLFFFCLFRPTSAAYGGSQARGLIGATAAGLRHSHSNSGSLTHWARPGIKPNSSWILVRLVNHWAVTWTPRSRFFIIIIITQMNLSHMYPRSRFLKPSCALWYLHIYMGYILIYFKWNMYLSYMSYMPYIINAIISRVYHICK